MTGTPRVPPHPAGLCSVCRHHRVTGNRRGSRFWLCGRAKDDPRFRRYPALPVLRCPGFELAPPDPWAELAGGTGGSPE